MSASAFPSRRRFLHRSAGGVSAAAGLAGWEFLGKLPHVSAQEIEASPGEIVPLRSEIEPLVRLLEETPRNRVIEEVTDRIRRGTSYREVLGALLLAGVRNIEPRPAVGFQFHAVLVVHSAHLASLSGPDSDRWLPILWAVDDFKTSQARDSKDRGWTMSPVDESRVPKPHRARKAFIDAMERWDEEAADAATAGVFRSLGRGELFDLFATYAARDLRSIGHKVIYLANAWRTLQIMGWEHAEPVLRSLSYALLNRGGNPNPADHDLPEDRPWRENGPLAESLSPTWRAGGSHDETTLDLLAMLREADPIEAATAVAKAVDRKNVGPSAVIDALFVGSSELMLRQPAIPALHAVTTTNAMHYVYRTCSDDTLRRQLLLQNASFLPMFLEFMHSRGDVSDLRIDTLEAGDPVDSTETVLAAGKREAQAKAILGFVGDEPNRALDLIDAVRRRIFLQGTDAHHYKFSSAVLEDFFHVSPAWRNQLLASGTQYLPGESKNPLADRIRAALAG